jgi:hypothetical protein
MSEVTKMIEPQEVIVLTTLNGNIDFNSLNPLIFMAQTTYLKSFLGLNLYTKIYTDFVGNTLTGNYLIIFDEYIKDLLIYKVSEYYVSFGGYKIGENGIHKISSENREVITESENNTLSLKFASMVANVESNFKEFVEPLRLAELQTKEININTTHPWL